MASSPVRPSSPTGEGSTENCIPENCMGPDSIRTMCDTIGAVLSEDASRELVSQNSSTNQLPLTFSLILLKFLLTPVQSSPMKFSSQIHISS